MSGWLSTHVLDTANGVPAAKMQLTLWRMDGPESKGEGHRPEFQYIKTVTTNNDGRTDAPLLEGKFLQLGFYEIIFSVGDYFAKLDDTLSKDRPFLSIVPICFGISDVASHYHVPLLVSPWSYSTYRGS
ncbi:MAG: hydroxyisourate hydrolase [Cyanobacteria bacterium J06627_32]